MSRVALGLERNPSHGSTSRATKGCERQGLGTTLTQVDLERELETLHQAGFGWALGCCRWDREEAADVLQSVYVKVLEGKAQFDGRSSLKTWFFATIRRTAAESRRRRWVRALALGRWAARRPSESPAAGADGQMVEDERLRALRKALERLPSRQREVLHLVFHEDLTLAEAAAVLAISDGTARKHYARGKARLRRALRPPATLTKPVRP